MVIATLQDLLGPIPEAEFDDRLNRREMTLWRGSDTKQFASLVDWQAIEALLGGGTFPLNKIRLTQRGVPLPQTFYTRNSRPQVSNVRQLLSTGASLILSGIDGHLAAVDALIKSIRAGTPDRVRTGVIVTAGTGGALPLHYDSEDLLIVQIEGSKQWRIHQTPVRNPVRGMRKPPAPTDGDALVQNLEAGDLLLLPAGYWHQCENGPGRSLHLGIFFVPPSLPRAVDTLRRRLLADVDARTPLTRRHASNLSLDEAAIKARLIAEISGMSLADFFADDAPTMAYDDPS